MNKPKEKPFKITGGVKRFDENTDYVDFFGRPDDVKAMKEFGEVVTTERYPDHYRLKIAPRFDSQEVFNYMKFYESQAATAAGE